MAESASSALPARIEPMPWHQAERWFLNRKNASEGKAFDVEVWDARKDEREPTAKQLVVLGVDGDGERLDLASDRGHGGAEGVERPRHPLDVGRSRRRREVDARAGRVLGRRHSPTAVSMVAWPLIMITGMVSAPVADHSLSKVTPSVSGQRC